MAGVLGAYLILFPRATILTLLILGFFIRLVHVPAIIVLGFWFVVQFAERVARPVTRQRSRTASPGLPTSAASSPAWSS